MFRSSLRRAAMALAIVAGCAAPAAYASLQVVDVPGFGTGSGTLDTVSGLTWLDLEYTRGLSFTDVTQQMAANGRLSGWRYATAAEWADLYRQMGFDPSIGMYIANPPANLLTAMSTAVGLLGNLASAQLPNNLLQGGLLGVTPAAGTHQFLYWSLSSSPNLTTYGQYFMSSGPYAGLTVADGDATFGGSYLVRVSAVPEPDARLALLLGAPCVVLCVRAARRDRRRAAQG